MPDIHLPKILPFKVSEITFTSMDAYSLPLAPPDLHSSLGHPATDLGELMWLG